MSANTNSDMCKDICKHFREGITKLPWTITQLVMLGILIYTVADTYPGNWIRCYLFDASGCAPRLTIEFTGADITPTELEQKRTDYKNLLANWPTVWNGFLIKEYVLEIDNIGVQYIRGITLKPSVFSKNNEKGLILLYKVKGGGRFGSSEEQSIKLSAADFREVTFWNKERATLRLVGAVKGHKGGTSKPQLRLEVVCPECQVKFEKVSYR